MVSNEMEPLVVNSGAAALDLIARQSNTLDMILMDITLGDMEGFDVIQTIRRNGVTTPVIIISGRNEDYDFMYGLSLGADDYVTKPFRPQILGAKVKALIRRSKSFSQENSQQISCGPFLCDTTTMRFYKNNVELNLSEKERSLLLLFVRHPQQVFTKDMIYEQIWGNLIAVDDNAIMVYINRLRSKIEVPSLPAPGEIPNSAPRPPDPPRPRHRAACIQSSCPSLSAPPPPQFRRAALSAP